MSHNRADEHGARKLMATDDQLHDLGLVTELLLQRRLNYKLQGRKLALTIPQEWGVDKTVSEM